MDMREYKAQTSRRLSRKWKQEGRCAHCGGIRDNEKFTICSKCREQSKIGQRKIRSTRITEGLCVRCGKVPIVDGYKTCEECTKKAYAYHKRDPKAIARARENYRKVKDEVFLAYGGYKCACCGEEEQSFLCIDHINGGGEKHRTEIGVGVRGRNMYTWLKKNGFPPGFQVLCHNCNMGKYLNGGICPHQTAKRAGSDACGEGSFMPQGRCLSEKQEHGNLAGTPERVSP